MAAAQPSSLRHPERIHPALWRATQLSRAQCSSISSGFGQLNQELPDQGWPLGTLIEILPAQPGIGEISLLSPALAQLDSKRSIALINPPHQPYFHCWRNWQLQQHRLLWIQPRTCLDTLWATEQTLRHNACAAVICWAGHVRFSALRRLHLAAQQTGTLLFLLRPQEASQQASAAPLRLRLQAKPYGLEVLIIKRRGPCSTEPLLITFSFARAIQGITSHVALDQSVSARPQTEHRYSAAIN
ncbi:translesion DNA synthesis-associated protein ImuA [Pollutimonas harenae]|uniref:Translesion DNA synthesis-associated protein ImuA n=1 Tax=Pollutimonas harenae TaxID=657015 RepID=A0A853H1N8_9BURK|nr:translesion DNA synthesis-associated protein ImuA [Pollutimonas harenae]NYT85940.1 translesion DNA synthesis-associated protein ImuA [Pollutimonas harenae]TEA70990.1 translesion DNA synthesis-associated protein ImuA [Pollutimonas harenae]